MTTQKKKIQQLWIPFQRSASNAVQVKFWSKTETTVYYMKVHIALNLIILRVNMIPLINVP